MDGLPNGAWLLLAGVSPGEWMSRCIDHAVEAAESAAEALAAWHCSAAQALEAEQWYTRASAAALDPALWSGFFWGTGETPDEASLRFFEAAREWREIARSL